MEGGRLSKKSDGGKRLKSSRVISWESSYFPVLGDSRLTFVDLLNSIVI